MDGREDARRRRIRPRWGASMKYIGQFCIIALFSLLGELLHMLIPFPIPAAIYGLALLFLALLCGLVKPDGIRQTADFFVVLLPMLFVPPLVGIVRSAALIRQNLIPILVILFAAAAVTFVVSGGAAQLLINVRRKAGKG